MKRDQISGSFWLILGIAICIGSVKLHLGTFSKPRTGFMPFLAGASMGLLGLILVVSSIIEGKNEEIKENKIWVKVNIKNILFTLLALICYGMFFNLLGFILATFLFFLLLFKLTEPRKWVMPLILSGVVTILSYLLFAVWLKCQFPIGIFKLEWR